MGVYYTDGMLYVEWKESAAFLRMRIRIVFEVGGWDLGHEAGALEIHSAPAIRWQDHSQSGGA
jgi:hypothetical protein